MNKNDFALKLGSTIGEQDITSQDFKNKIKDYEDSLKFKNAKLAFNKPEENTIGNILGNVTFGTPSVENFKNNAKVLKEFITQSPQPDSINIKNNKHQIVKIEENCSTIQSPIKCTKHKNEDEYINEKNNTLAIGLR